MDLVLKDYYKELERLAVIKYGEMTDEVQLRVQKVFDEQVEKIKDKEVEFINPFPNNGSLVKEVETVNFLQKVDELIANDSVFTYLGLFESKKNPSPVSKLLLKMLKDRSKFKSLMLKSKAEGDETLARLYDNTQKLKKEIANSLYGILGLKSFFLFNTITSGSVTGNSSYQIRTLISQAEKIYGGRVILRDFEDLFQFLTGNYIDFTNQCSEEELSRISGERLNNFFRNQDKDKLNSFNEEELLSKIKNKYCTFDFDSLSEKQKETVDFLIARIFQSPLNKVRFYYLNELELFLKDSPVIREIIIDNKDNICNLESFNEKEMNEIFDEKFLPFIQYFLYDRAIQKNQNDLVTNYPRTTVVISDTDSMFIKSKPLTDDIKNTITDVTENIERHDLETFTFRILTYLTTQLTKFQLDFMAKNHHRIKEHFYNYKSEYFYRKLINFTAKKTYAGLCTVQEGYKIPPFLDEKNLSKTSYTGFSVNLVLELINNLLNSDKFSYKIVFDYLDSKKKEAMELIITEKDFSLGSPFKYKTADNYENPYAVSNFIAGEIYNIFHPDDRIQSGTRCFKLDFKATNLKFKRNASDEEKIEQILNYYEDKLPEYHYEILKKTLSEHDNGMRTLILKNSGIPYIGIPENGEIEEWMVQFINVELLVSKNIDTRTTSLLEAIGVYVNSNTNMTNISRIIRL